MMTIVISSILVFLAICALFAIFYFIWKKFKRVTSIEDLPPKVYGIWLSGYVTSVSDGDGFKFFHVPWFRSSNYTSEDLLRIRLAGIDAPELANFEQGKPAQPFSQRAKHELELLILEKKVKIKLLGIDRYKRLLAMCFLTGPCFFTNENINMKMVELGMACVYKGGNAVYDNCKDKFIELEATAKEKGLGMWSQGNYISPMDYKRMHMKKMERSHHNQVFNV